MLAINDTSTVSPRLLTVQEVSAILHVSTREIYRALNSGTLRSVKIGRLRRITWTQLESYIAELERRGA